MADNGPGISAEDREKLFLPYFSTKVAGMGLGLPIVHEIVTEHGGTIWVEDNEPSGTRFVIEVPVSRARVAGRGLGAMRQLTPSRATETHPRTTDTIRGNHNPSAHKHILRARERACAWGAARRVTWPASTY